jgi:hypothetical protein
MSDIDQAATEVLRLVQTFKSLETVGAALRDIGSLDHYRAEITLDIARLKGEQRTLFGAVATAQADAKAKISALNQQIADAIAAQKDKAAEHVQWQIDAGKERSRQLAEQKRLDAALAETRERMKQLAATAG